jgi:MFS transporter, DHA2 family, multidrug resistance protein
VHTSYWLMAPVFIIMGHGMASVMAPMTAAVMNAVGPQRAGLGSAMTNTSREVGGVFGIALLGTILTTKLKASLTPALAGLGLTGAQQNAIAVAGGHGTLDASVLKGLSPTQVNEVINAYGRSFMDGFHVALFIGGLVLVGAAIVANRFIPGRHTEHVPAPGDHVPVAVEA